MNIESTIRENINKLKNDYTNIYISPDIPTKKLDNAIAAYARKIISIFRMLNCSRTIR